MFTLFTKCPCLTGKIKHALQYSTELGISERLTVHSMVLIFYQFLLLAEFNLAYLEHNVQTPEIQIFLNQDILSDYMQKSNPQGVPKM
jgi:hypothetical protein